MSRPATHHHDNPRHWVIGVLTPAAARFPDLDPVHDVPPVELLGRQRTLAVAILRTVLQRWLTLEHVLDAHLRQPCARIEPALRATLLTGAAQILFMRTPAYAAVDEAVSYARRAIRPGAGGLVNAVLRKVAGEVAAVAEDQPWTPAANVLPLERGVVRLGRDLLPDPRREPARHLALATSHPPALIERWRRDLGPEAAQQAALRGIRTPELVVVTEPSFDRTAVSDLWRCHDEPGFIVWTGSLDELRRFLAEHPQRRVQDPASAHAVALAAGLAPRMVWDPCAGRGTKSVQLAAMFPDATVHAADPNGDRFASLREVCERWPNLRAVRGGEPARQGPHDKDLILLDVPCSNTAVLGRRPEARYRYSDASVVELVRRQREIAALAIEQHLGPAGAILYSTCSLDRRENQEQAAWIAARMGGKVVQEQLTIPGEGHDGGYAALVRR